MARQYTHVQAVEKEMLAMKEAGKTNRELAEYFGFKDQYFVKRWISRYHQNQRLEEAGVLPRRRGRPPKGYVQSEQEKENEIRRLKMENELLRDFCAPLEGGEGVDGIWSYLPKTGTVFHPGYVPIP